MTDYLGRIKSEEKQLEEERKIKERDYISEWYRWVELTQKYLKNKLN